MSSTDKFSFGKHKGKSFRDIAREDPKYHVRYMSVLKKNGRNPPRILLRYISWRKKAGASGSIPSNRTRRREDGSNERFTFGSKRGQTFRQVARDDPSYHLRCAETGYNPDPDQMGRYLDYFSRYGDHHAASRGEREAIGFAIGICPVDYFRQYDSD